MNIIRVEKVDPFKIEAYLTSLWKWTKLRMLIVSKFHDYYDTASIYGVDKTCVYLRNDEKIEIHGRGGILSRTFLLKDGTRFPLGKVASYEDQAVRSVQIIEFKKAILGFCGEIYPMIKVIKTWNGHPRPEPETYCFYDQPSFANFIAEEGIVSKKYRYGSWGRERFDLDSDQGINNFFDHNRWTKLEGLFAAYHVPCWVLRERTLKINPES
jgi:hypothetical protein